VAHAANVINGTIKPVAASGPGALPGYEFRCGDCPEVAAFSVEGMTRDHALSHTNFMAGQEREARLLECWADYKARYPEVGDNPSALFRRGFEQEAS